MSESSRENTSIYYQRIARQTDERRKKLFNANYKKNTKQALTSCPDSSTNATRDLEEGQLEYARRKLDRPVEFWKNVETGTFLDPLISGISGAKKNKKNDGL